MQILRFFHGQEKEMLAGRKILLLKWSCPRMNVPLNKRAL